MLILIKVSSIKIPLPFMVQKSGGWRVWCLLFLTHLQLKRMHMPKWNILGWYVLIPHKCQKHCQQFHRRCAVSSAYSYLPVTERFPQGKSGNTTDRSLEMQLKLCGPDGLFFFFFFLIWEICIISKFEHKERFY